MPIAAVDPNIQYARPIQVSSEPVNAYFTARAAQQRNAYEQARLGLAAESEADRIAAARQKDIQNRMKLVANLGNYGVGGLWHNEQMQKITDYQNTLAKMIKDGDPNYQQYAIQAAGELEGNRQKAMTYDKLMKDKMAEYSKDKSIDPAKFQNYWVSHTAYNDKGLIPIEDIDLNDMQQFNPLVRPDFSPVVNTAELSHRLASNFKANTLTNAVSNRANGVTNATTTTTSAPSYMRVNGMTGHLSLNTDEVGKDPVLSDHLFDRFRTKAGTVDLLKEGIYQDHLGDPGIRAAIARAINGHNAGLKPTDNGYVEPGSYEASLIGRAVMTNLLAGQQHGNFSLKRTYGVDKGSGSGSGSSTKLNEAGLLDRLNGVMNQDPAYLQNNPVEGNPVSNRTDKAIGLPPGYTANVTPVLKGLNVGVDDKGKPVQAKAILVKKDDPGAIYIDYGDGKPAQRVTKQELPTWLNQISKYNKGLDPVTLNKLYPEKLTPPTAEPFPTIPTKTAPATTPLQAVKNAAKKAWASFKVKSK